MSTYHDGSGYRSGNRLSPTALTGVVLVHAGLGAAVLTMTMVQFAPPVEPVITTRNIPIDPEPPEVAPDPVKPEVKVHREAVDKPSPQVDLPRPDEGMFVIPPMTDFGKMPTGSTGDFIGTPTLPPEPPAPVLTQARPDGRFAGAFQPPYPAGMIRLQKEGAVTVRITIDADGRVRDVVLVSAADPAFFEATRKQALARWRFLPATRDGVPVVSERVMTVHFRLTE